MAPREVRGGSERRRACRAGAGAARWARASCFSTRNKVGRPKSSRGPEDLQRARGGPWRPTVGSDEGDPGGCGRLLPILRTAVGRGSNRSLVGRRGVRPRAGSEARRFSPSRVDVLRAFPRASGGAGLMGRQRGAASTVLAKAAFFARGRRSPRESRIAALLDFLPGSAGVWLLVAAAVMTLPLSLSFLRAQRAIFWREGRFYRVLRPSSSPGGELVTLTLTLARSGC